MFKTIACICVFSVISLCAQTEPDAAQWKTWVIPSASTYRLPPPPDANGTAAELTSIKNSIANLTPDQLTQIRFWDAGAPGYRWMQLTQQLAVSEGLAAPLQTRALALVAAAIYDATIASWDSKYAYMRQHPAEVDSTVTPLVTPVAAPSYPSEHAATAAAAAAVLAYVFPDQAASVSGMAQQAAMSRVLASAAFPSDVSGGTTLGSNVGQAVIAYAQADASDQVYTVSFP